MHPYDSQITARLHALREQLLTETERIAATLGPALEEATINQRITAIAQLTDRILRLSNHLPAPEETTIFTVEPFLIRTTDLEDDTPEEAAADDLDSLPY
jgi:hypothetical protein